MENETKIAVAGTGYVGLSIATLLSQHNPVTAVDVIPEKVELINNRCSPIQDDYIEEYISNKPLQLTATLWLSQHLLITIRLETILILRTSRK